MNAKIHTRLGSEVGSYLYDSQFLRLGDPIGNNGETRRPQSRVKRCDIYSHICNFTRWTAGKSCFMIKELHRNVVPTQRLAELAIMTINLIHMI